jgi:hypothetical protein
MCFFFYCEELRENIDEGKKNLVFKRKVKTISSIANTVYMNEYNTVGYSTQTRKVVFPLSSGDDSK